MIFYLTFGVNHPLSNNWVEIEAPDKESAKKAAFDTFKDKWAFLYSKENFDTKYFPAGKSGKTLKGAM